MHADKRHQRAEEGPRAQASPYPLLTPLPEQSLCPFLQQHLAFHRFTRPLWGKMLAGDLSLHPFSFSPTSVRVWPPLQPWPQAPGTQGAGMTSLLSVRRCMHSGVRAWLLTSRWMRDLTEPSWSLFRALQTAVTQGQNRPTSQGPCED